MAAGERPLGRDRELSQLSELLAHAGESGALVPGPPGAGKTTLIEVAVEDARDFRVLRATGAELERELPYGGLAGDPVRRPDR